VFSITNEDDPNYWTDGNYDSWLAEMAGSRLLTSEMLMLMLMLMHTTTVYYTINSSG
jgi:hypothetical protein